METNKAKNKTSWLSWLGFILLMAAIILVFQFVIEITVVSGHSMNPTIEDGDILLTNKSLFNEERGAVVLFEHEDGFDTIKRIVGLPGETITIDDGVVYINGDPLEEEYINGISSDYEETVILENHYFLIGDNREPGESLDSRSTDIGVVHENDIKGKVSFSLAPLKKFGTH